MSSENSDSSQSVVENAAPTIEIDGGVGYGPGLTGGYRSTIADIDGDGDLDIVRLNDDASSMIVLLNDGSGKMTAASPISLPADSYSLSIASLDVDGDGLSDLIAADFSQGQVLWAKGNSDGTLGTFQQLASGFVQSTNIATADIDGDGLTDFVIDETDYSGSGRLSWFRNEGDGSFTRQDVIATPYQAPKSYAVGDLNGDGQADFVFADAGDQIRSYVSDGQGDYVETGVFDQYAGGLTLGDIDGDGKLDLVYTVDYDHQIVWKEGNGDGTFGNSHVIATTSEDGAYPQEPELVDINGDGRLDVIEAATKGASGTSPLSWYENEGNGTFVEHEISGIGYPGYGAPNIEVGDLNGDGTPDIVSQGGMTLSRPALQVAENVATALTGITFGNGDSAGEVTVTLAVERGTLQASAGDGVAVSGAGGSLALTGTIEAINAYIAASNVTFLTALYDRHNVALQWRSTMAPARRKPRSRSMCRGVRMPLCCRLRQSLKMPRPARLSARLSPPARAAIP